MRNLKYIIAIFLIYTFSFPLVALSQFSNERVRGFYDSQFIDLDRADLQLSQSRNLKIDAGWTMLQTKLVPVSIWGGSGIRVSVELKSIKIEYACADGEIVGRLRVDSRGNFKTNGFHLRQRPGPVRVDAKPQRQPALYEGKITGKTMTISVTLTETGENVGTFELKRDITPRLIRCL